VESFCRHHPDIGWARYYLDDASDAQDEMRDLLVRYGFEPVALHTERAGCTPSTYELARRVLAEIPDLDLILYLQNDFEFIRPVPVELVKKLFLEDNERSRRLGCFRLAGHWQYPGRFAMHENWHRPTRWYKLRQGGEDLEIGQAPFVYNPPSIIRSDLFTYLLSGARNEKGVAKRSDNIPYLTIRMVGNITQHIGRVKTPAGKFGK
jgi:hypothetical protein